MSFLYTNKFWSSSFSSNLIFIYERLLWCFESVFGVKIFCFFYSCSRVTLCFVCTGKRDNRKAACIIMMFWCRVVANTERERQLYHDVLIIQRKLCSSFFTALFSAISIVVDQQDVTLAVRHHLKLLSIRRLHRRIKANLMFAHNRKLFIFWMRAHLLCIVSLLFPDAFWAFYHLTAFNLCWHFQHFSFSLRVGKKRERKKGRDLKKTIPLIHLVFLLLYVFVCARSCCHSRP